MLPVKFVRENLAAVKEAAALKNERVPWDRFEELDSRRRGALATIEERRRIQNDITGKIADAKGDRERIEPLLRDARAYSEQIRAEETALAEVEKELDLILARIPNMPHQSVPRGADPSANVVVRTWGETAARDFAPPPHWDTGVSLGILDFERGSKISGSAFPVFRGAGALLVRALMNFMLDLHRAAGFEEVWVPALVNRESMFGTGQLPKLEEDMYRLEKDDLFLIPTAEVPVTNLLRGETLQESDLPRYFTAYTPCFRREAGAYGKDTRGLIRVHQFDKVEMVKFTTPQTSYDELESLLGEAEKVLQALRLPYRVLSLCTGDLSFAASKCYDIEVWAPGVNRWLEVSSCSNFEAFQARRAGIRYRSRAGKVEHLHTLNGSGLAFPRTVIGIIENHLQKDGSVLIPEVLRPYMGGMDRIAPR